MGYAGKAYFFKGNKYVRYDWTKDQGDPGYPLGLDEWGFPAPFDKGIDAAIEGREGYAKKAFFFKDDKYRKYDWTGDSKVESSPKSIDAWGLPKDFFPGGKKKIDAAVNGVGEEARYCYLLSGTNWVRIDWKEEEDPVLHKGSLQADWGLPADIAKGIDAALSGWGKKYGGKAYFFADKKYARFDWDADKCDSANGDFGAWKLTWGRAQAGAGWGGAAGLRRCRGTRRPGAAGVERPEGQAVATRAARATPAPAGGLPARPHQRSQVVRRRHDARQRRHHQEGRVGDERGQPGGVHDRQRLDQAHRHCRPERQAGGPARRQQLEEPGPRRAFIDDVTTKKEGKARAQGAEIDLDQVAVVGWSGAEAVSWAKASLKMEHQGGTFSAGGGGTTLMLLGLADTLMAEAYSKSIRSRQKGSGTIVYSVHKDGGGGVSGPDGPYVKGFDLHHDPLKDAGQPLPSPAEEKDRDAFALYADDGDQQKPPTCTVVHVKDIDRHWAEIVGPAKASGKSRPAHDECRWCGPGTALQRYFHK